MYRLHSQGKYVHTVFTTRYKMSGLHVVSLVPSLPRYGLVSTSRLETHLGKGYEHYCELQKELTELVRLRKITIEELSKIADSLDKHHKNANIAKLVGSGVGIAGGVVSVVGLALIPVTAGISVVVAGVGAGVAALGGATAAGTDVVEFVITITRGAQKVIDEDRKQVEKVVALWAKYEEECVKIIKEIEAEVPDKEYSPSTWYGKLRRLLKQKWASFKEWADKISMNNHTRRILFLWDIFSVGKAILRGVVGAYDVGVAILRGLEACAKPGPIGRLIITVIGRSAAIGFDAAFTAIGLILDIITFVKTAYDLSKGSHSAAAKKLREVVASLEKEQKSWNHLFLE